MAVIAAENNQADICFLTKLNKEVTRARCAWLELAYCLSLG
jgi:hypothetical protein